MDYSPALSVTSDLTDEELDKYFASYVPLSNLPTPPVAREQHTIPNRASPSTSTMSEEQLDAFSAPEAQAYAKHLANLVPLNVSTRRPRASAIQCFLERASLPDEIVAFSACILDALSDRFAATWRDVLAPSDYARDLENFLTTDYTQSLQISPDVIVLAALSLAHGFLVDRLRSPRHWSQKESGGSFTVQEIESTQRAILQDMNYGLFRISEDRVQRRLRAMQLAAALPSTAPLTEECAAVMMRDQSRDRSLSLTGAGVWSHGVQTPEPSP